MVNIILICCLKDSEAEWNYAAAKIDIFKDPDGVHIPMLLDFCVAQDLAHFLPPSESLGSLLKSFRQGFAIALALFSKVELPP